MTSSVLPLVSGKRVAITERDPPSASRRGGGRGRDRLCVGVPPFAGTGDPLCGEHTRLVARALLAEQNLSMLNGKVQPSGPPGRAMLRARDLRSTDLSAALRRRRRTILTALRSFPFKIVGRRRPTS